MSGLGFVLDFVPIVRMLPGTFGNMFREAIAERDLFLNKFYFSVKNAASEADGGEQDEQGMVINLIRLQHEINKHAKSEIITESDLKGIVLDIGIASTDTTVSSLINAFALLLTHQKVAQKIRNEVDDVVGSSRLSRFSDRETMPYTMVPFSRCYDILLVPHLFHFLIKPWMTKTSKDGSSKNRALFYPTIGLSTMTLRSGKIHGCSSPNAFWTVMGYCSHQTIQHVAIYLRFPQVRENVPEQISGNPAYSYI